MSRRDLVWLVIVAVIAVLFYGLTPMIAGQDAVYHRYGPLIEVDALVRREYVREVRSDVLVDGAIEGLVARLDPFSGYVPAREMADYLRRNTGRYIGVGIEVGLRNGVMTVIAPVDGGPASRAGVRPGDVLLAVDGRATDELSVFDVERLLAGEAGTTAKLGLRRGGLEFRVGVAREDVVERSVRGFALDAAGEWQYLLDGSGVAYLRVSRFGRGMVEEFDAVLERPEVAGAAGVIVDLRFNMGGLMDEAVAMVDRFVDSGVIVERVNRWGAAKTYLATDQVRVEDRPVVVLVNGATASSAEIVAGALQDRGRAVVVGDRTYGKGSVQDFLRIQGGDAGLRLTVAYYRLPGGRMIHRTPENAETDAWGILPDVVVPLSDDQRAAVVESRRTVDSWSAPGGRSAASAHDQTAGSSGEAARMQRPRLIVDRQLDAAVKAVKDRAAAGAL